MPVDGDRRPFGSRRAAEQEPRSQDQPEPQPVPVLHVGEVHAELRLHITDDTLSDLGTQIANLIANASYQGFRAGMETAMADIDAEEPAGPPEFVAGEAAVPPGPAAARNKTGAAEPVLTEEQMRRARGE
jgi:hypothetical protein